MTTEINARTVLKLRWYLQKTKQLFLVLTTSALLTSCMTLPPVLPTTAENGGDKLRESCLRPFLAGKYRLVHAIEATMTGGTKANLIGILLADPETKAIHAVFMTIEGFVLFDARYDNELLRVIRAVPPFDSNTFAEGMMNDIRLMVFAPDGQPEAIGALEDGSPVCRYNTGLTTTTDILFRQTDGTGTWEIRIYAGLGQLTRRITVLSLDDAGIPDKIDFDAYDFYDYSLRLRLITAEPASAGEPSTEIKDDDQ